MRIYEYICYTAVLLSGIQNTQYHLTASYMYVVYYFLTIIIIIIKIYQPA